MVQFAVYPSPFGPITIGCENNRIVSIRCGRSTVVHCPCAATDLANIQLQEYFEGKRKSFDLPIELRGTPFQIAVWNALLAIPYGEVRKHYRSVKKNLHKRLAKEKESQAVVKLKIETLDTTFSICKVENYSEVNIEEPFCFIGSTDEEKSLVCPTQQIPAHYLKREDGWRGFRIAGVLDFSLIGIMARKSSEAAFLSGYREMNSI